VKQITAIGLVLLMSLQCFYKLGVITYFTLNQEYIAEVLCINKEKPMTMCYGTCFLKRNLDLADQSSADKTGAPAGRMTVDFPVFLISQITYRFDIVSRPDDSNSCYSPGMSMAHLRTPFRPPAHRS